MMKFEEDSYFESPASNSDQMIFDFDDGQGISPDMGLPWNSFESHPQQGYMPESSLSPSNPFDFQLPPTTSNALFNSGPYSGLSEMRSAEDTEFHFSQWLKEPECPPLDASSSPIPIRPGTSIPLTPPPFHSYVEHYTFPQDASFSPSDFAALPLPQSPPAPVFSDNFESYPTRYENGYDIPSSQPPAWASQLWQQDPSPSHSYSSRSPVPHSPLSHTPYPIQRQSFETRRRTSSIGQMFESSGQMFQSSSAPSPVHTRAPALSRTYSRRAESTSQTDDRDATVRRKKRLTSPEVSRSMEAPDTRKFRPFPYALCTWLTEILRSSIQVYVTTPEAGAFRMAAVLHGLDLKTPGNQYPQAECCAGCQGGWPRVCSAHR